MQTQRMSPPPGGFSGCQLRMKRLARPLRFRAAVRVAVDTAFDFTHRTSAGKALWSDTVSVWLGRATFIHWAMGEVHNDIPRIVAETDGAPDDPDDLNEAVYLELAAYWANRLATLPPKSTPAWLPLP